MSRQSSTLSALVVAGLLLFAASAVYGQLPVTSGLHAWYSVDSLASQQDGSDVTHWPNIAGDPQLDLFPSGTPPTYSVSGFRDGPSVQFSAFTPLSTPGHFGLSGDVEFTAFFVGTIHELTFNTNQAWTWGNGLQPLSAAGLEIENPQSPRLDLATGYAIDAITPNGSFASSMGNPVIITVSKSPGPLNTTTRIFIDGVEQSVGGSSSTPNIDDRPLSLGANAFGAHSPIMNVAEVVFYSRPLSSAEIASVESYLHDKYTYEHDAQVLQVILPSDIAQLGEIVVPIVLVANNGIGTETIPVTVEIGADYSETSSITLEAGTSGDVVFPPWAADMEGSFDVFASTSLSGDERPLNDTLQTLVTVLEDTTSFGLVAYFPFNGNANDESGNGHDGIVNGATLTEDRHGNLNSAYSFDGINDYIVASADELPTAERTVSLWFYANTVANRPGLFGYGGNGGPPGTSWLMMINDSGVPAYTVDVHYPQGNRLSFPYFEEPVGEWHHFAAITDPSGTTLFVDGSPVASASFFIDNTYVDGKHLSIGVVPSGYGIAPYTDSNVSYFNGVIDDVRVYDRALSAREVEALTGLEIITSSTLAAQLGKSSSFQLQAKGGSDPYTWSVVDGMLPAGMSVSGDGVFSGIPEELGDYRFTAQVMDGVGDVDEREFTVSVVLVLPPPILSIEKRGITAVPGRVIDYFISVENTGSVEAREVVVEEHLISSRFSTEVFEFVSGEPAPEFVADGLVAVWVIPLVGPGKSEMLSYRVRLNAAIPLGTTISGNACRNEDDEVDLGALKARMSGASYNCAVCVNACNLSYCNGLADCTRGCGTIKFWPFKKICLSACGIAFSQCAGCLTGCADNECKSECEGHNLLAAGSDNTGCLTCASGCGCDEQEASGPVDPNEKLVVAERFIQPDQTLVYPIHFENIGEVEALDVFVTDELDPRLDESTLQLLTPDGAAYDPTTRTLRWELLDRNLQPGETDNVLLSIKPVPGLPSGTEIRNTAEIQFEVFDPLVTPEVVNIIDTTRPNCLMDALPAVTSTEEFTVSWTGTDAVGEIEAYAVFVSTDGTGWEPFLAETTETSSQFVGEEGITYGFLCGARDTAGNTEEDSLVAEATTTVVLNQPPVADANGPYLVEVGETVMFNGSGSSDPDGDSLTETWTADGAAVSGNMYTAGTVAGIYDVTLVVNDGSVNSEPAYTAVVVYDPEGGFVTGGGWIYSEAGSCQLDDICDDAEGKATFGFNSKYKKGATEPTGETQFRFNAGDLNFHSDSYEWLVVTGSDYAKFKGLGTINGSGAYKFMLWAGDSNPDTFRIKMWTEDELGVEDVVYDNGFDQAIGGGQIVVHTGKK